MESTLEGWLRIILEVLSVVQTALTDILNALPQPTPTPTPTPVPTSVVQPNQFTQTGNISTPNVQTVQGMTSDRNQKGEQPNFWTRA